MPSAAHYKSLHRSGVSASHSQDSDASLVVALPALTRQNPGSNTGDHYGGLFRKLGHQQIKEEGNEKGLNDQ
jgi:hypothetical protein